MTNSTCRWGILGAAFIARKNWQAIRDAGNARLVAVASRDLARAQAFIAECQSSAPHPVLPEATDSYEALLARTDIDAVYIPLPTAVRKEWVLRAAQAGKHVLVEKPVGCNASDVAEVAESRPATKVAFIAGFLFDSFSLLPMSHLTKLLKNAAGGDSISLNQLYEQVYGELRAIAARKMAAERPRRRLTPTNNRCRAGF